MTIFFVAIAIAAAIWNAVTTIAIFEYLQKKDQDVSFLWLKVLGPVYAERYKKLTLSETGKVGSLFYHWIISINVSLAGVLAIVVTLI